MIEYLMDTKVLISIAVVVTLLLVAAGVYWWRSRITIPENKPVINESVPEQIDEKPTNNPVVGDVHCPDCNDAMVIASEDKSVRKCLRCDKAYEVSQE